MQGGILVLAEHLRGNLSEISYEMLGAAGSLVAEGGGPITAVLLGDAVSGLAGRLGAADRVLVVESPELNAPVPWMQTGLLRALLETPVNPHCGFQLTGLRGKQGSL